MQSNLFNNLRSSILIIALMAIVSIDALAQKKPNIVILATGGTIAGAGGSSVKGQYKAGQLPVEELIEAVPEAKEFANLSGQQVANIGSQAMNNETWLKIAKKIKELANDDNVDGIVITHGTDTMEETAFFVDLTTATDKPIVFVGAMRSATALSADGPKNLYNAIGIAARKDSWGRGVLVTLNDEIIAARFVTKTNTTAVNAFTGREFGILGYVYDAVPVYYQRTEKRTTAETVFDITDRTSLPQVDIVYGYSNTNENLIKTLINEKVDGIVFAGVGNGNIYPTAMDQLERAVKQGIKVVRSARVGSGRTTLGAEVDDEKYGFIASDFLNPQKARVLLMLSLTKTKDYVKIQENFLEF
ncbi:type II asparaginase [Aureibacter tunicatorum]|uniref:L-asparaginase n=1 Tax=Aureibacter tunicatorum TaxID=866807 RepID=A0AAE4BQV8_9BACT|nr:type II asparaginase [Aureibacter tunicatorum]MDR6239589.1 L-asparaginase [Aureibacter tunicatorum]BDD04066.1 L-asparaginase 2 [Aureibacter tunicatorum]